MASSEWRIASREFSTRYSLLPIRYSPLSHHPDLAEIFEHAGMDQIRVRRSGNGIDRGGLTNIGQLLAECALNTMQRARQVIGDVVGQAFADQDETPRPH